MSEAECLRKIEVSALGRANAKLREENNQLKARCHQLRRQADNALAECKARDKIARAVEILKAIGLAVWIAAGVAVFIAGMAKLGAWVMYIIGR